MANGINKLMNFLKLTDEDDEFDDDLYDDEYDYEDQKELEREEKRLQKERRKEEKRTMSSASYRNEMDYEEDTPVIPKRSSYRSSSSGSKVVQMPSSSHDMEVCIVKPSNIGESQQVCDLLMGSHPVIVNLEGIDIMEAQRIMDFISGCIFAISGNMCQVSRYIFIFSPKDVDISGDYIKSLENEESYNMANFHKEF
ncbi:MAG: cell division protein SepF [Clostridiaceae bacterium]|nr:cell division protein SepF [Clostridiaceae bacterium]